MKTCHRCSKPLGNSYEVLFDKNYHTHPCYVMTLVLYNSIKHETGGMTIESLNVYLKLRQYAGGTNDTNIRNRDTTSDP